MSKFYATRTAQASTDLDYAMGSVQRGPFHTEDEAFAALADMIASEKATVETNLVDAFTNLENGGAVAFWTKAAAIDGAKLIGLIRAQVAAAHRELVIQVVAEGATTLVFNVREDS